MVTKIGTLRVVLTAATDDFEKGLGKANKITGKWGAGIKTAGTLALGGMVTAAAGATAAVAGVGVALGKMAIEAAPLQGIETAFEKITERSGQSADAMLAALEKSSAGMVAQRDLMTSYNQAASLVGDTFANRLPDAMGVLTKAAAATDQDMGYMMDSLVKGVGRVSPLILDNLGVQMDMNQALEDYAKKHGIAAATATVDHSKAIADLTQKMGFAEREQASLAQAHVDANDELAEAGKWYAKGSVDLNKFQSRVDKTKLAMDKKSASIVDMQDELAKLQGEHGTTAEGAQDLTEVLSKEQQQMALFEQVVAKLEDQYADMPDVQDNVATSMAALRAKMQNFKDTIGKAVLPILGKFMAMGAELAEKVMPIITNFIETTLVPLLERLAEAFGIVFDSIMDGTFSVETIAEALGQFLPQDIIDRVMGFIASIQELIATVRPYIEQAMAWVSQHVELKDVLIAFGIAIAAVIVPAVAGIVSAAAGVAIAIAALIAIVAAVRSAWETDWMGIRTALTAFWEDTAKPAFEQLKEWLSVAVPAAMQTLSDFWKETLVPTFTQLRDWLQTNIPAAIEVLSTFWHETLMPALQTIWDFITEYIIPLFEALAELMEAVVGLAVTVLAGLWQNVLWPALEKVWAFVQDKVIPIFEALTVKTESRLGPKLKWLKEQVLDKVLSVFKKIKTIIIKVIAYIESLALTISQVQLPDWLTPGSPTPFETGLKGIADAVRREVNPSIRELAFNLGMAGVTPAETIGQQYNVEMNVATAASAPEVVQALQTMMALL